jgi:PAS domain-containing protein
MTEPRSDNPTFPKGPLPLRELVDHPTPARLLAITALSVFVGEVIVMLVLAVIPEVPTLAEALLDGFMITVLATPVLLLFLFRPMVQQIRQRRQAEEKLQLLNDQLELRVEERTRELTAANEQLRREMADRLTAEAGLSRSTDFIHRVLAAAPCLLAIYDVNTMKCSFINERVNDLLGYTPDEALMAGPDFFKALFSAEDLNRFRELNMKIGAGIEQGITTCECRLRTADKTFIPFGIGLVPVATAGRNEAKEVLLAAVPSATGWPESS